MRSFRRLADWPIPTSAVWLLTDIAEAKGRSELFARQSPQALKALREAALVQSAESSNRIEGVTVARGRLRPLVLGAARLSRDMVRRVLRDLRAEGGVSCQGRGPGARWTRRGTAPTKG